MNFDRQFYFIRGGDVLEVVKKRLKLIEIK